MFRKKSFVFIGHFKQKDKITKQELKKIVRDRGGKNITSISNQTDYVIFPKRITNDERNNQQTKKIKNIYSKSINFVYSKWLLDSVRENKKLPVNQYRIEEFYNLLPTFNEYFNINETVDPFYKDMISNNCKIWKEYLDGRGNIYYFNSLNGESTTTPCKDFKNRLIGSNSITENDYTTESTGLKIEKDVDSNIKSIDECLHILRGYMIVVGKKRKKNKFDWIKEDFLRKKKKKKRGGVTHGTDRYT